MPFTNLTNLGVTATFNDLFNSHNTLISRGNSLGIGSIFAGNGITATALDSSGGITLSARLNQGSGITLTQGAGITIGLNTAFITGGTGINVSSSTSGITVSVKLNAGNNITLNSGPAGITISSSGGGGGDPTFTNSGTSTSIGLSPNGNTFQGKTALEILDIILFPYQSVSFSNFTSGLGGILFELGQTAGNGTYTATWTAGNPLTNWIAGSGQLSFQNFSDTAFTPIISGFSPTGGNAPWTNAAFRGTTFTSNSISNRIVIRLSGAQTQGSSPSTDQIIRWWSKSYWGRSSSDPTTRFLSDGSETFIQTTPGTSSTFTATFGSGSSQHLYILIPDKYTITNFVDTSNSQPSPFDLLTPAVNIQNAHGLSIPYKRYKSENPVAGGITLILTYN